MQEKRHYALFTVANQGIHHEVVYRMEGMLITQNHLIAVKQAASAQLQAPLERIAIVGHVYLGFMTEEEFSGEPQNGQG